MLAMKSTKIIFVIALLLVQFAHAQNKKLSYVAVQAFPISFHGSGDLGGIQIGVQHGSPIHKRWDLQTMLTTSMHHGKFEAEDRIFGFNFDASLREVTAGIQVGQSMAYRLLGRSDNHSLELSAGYLLRYQLQTVSQSVSRSTSMVGTDTYTQFSFRHDGPFPQFNLGYQVQIAYNYTTTQGWMMGTVIHFQNDTWGDVITGIGLRVGRAWEKKRK
jgi:hypothetical protein